jgi:rubredoxin
MIARNCPLSSVGDLLRNDCLAQPFPVLQKLRDNARVAQLPGTHTLLVSVRARAVAGAASDPASVWECAVCLHLCDPAIGDPEHDFPPGTPFAELPAEWRCP